MAQCIFVPYFSYAEGAIHFATIYHVFGARNTFNLLAQLPLGDRFAVVDALFFKPQARLQDPVYGAYPISLPFNNMLVICKLIELICRVYSL